jgi:hypothetical protein
MRFEVLAIILLLNVGATIALWGTAVRQPRALKKNFLKKLRNSTPIAPNHQPPKISGEEFSSLVPKEDRRFFDDFEDFGKVVNWWLANEHVGGPWRLQELPDAELSLRSSDTPVFGRRYAIFHNQIRLGTLELGPGFDYSPEKPAVRTNLELDRVRLIAFHSLRRFLFDIAMHVCDARGNSPDYLQAHASIDCALTRVLWTVQQLSGSAETEVREDYGELELQLHGSAAWFFQRREALRRQRAAAKASPASRGDSLR